MKLKSQLKVWLKMPGHEMKMTQYAKNLKAESIPMLLLGAGAQEFPKARVFPLSNKNV